MRAITNLTLVALIAATLAAGALGQGIDRANWDETARQVIPEIEARIIEFPDFVRVYRKGGCTVDIEVRISRVAIPLKAQARFSFHDADDDGAIHEGEMTWKQTYVSSRAIALGMKDFKNLLFTQMALPVTATLRASKVTGEALPTGYKLTFGAKIQDEDIPFTLHVDRNYIVNRAEMASSEARTTMSFEYRKVGRRVVVKSQRESSTLTEGGQRKGASTMTYREQDGCVIPVHITKMTQNIGMGVYVQTTATMGFSRWKFEKRPRVLPRPGDDPIGDPPPPPPPPPPPIDPPVRPPTDVVPPDRTPRAGGAAEARAHLASLDRRYLSLAATGARSVIVSVAELNPVRPEDVEFEFTWTAPRTIAPAPFLERRDNDRDFGAAHLALMRNPLLVPFSTIRLSESARLERGAGGRVTVSDPAARPPVAWTFDADGRLLSLRTGAAGEERVRAFTWMTAGGGLLLKRSSFALTGGAEIYEQFEYGILGSMLLPVRIEVGGRTAALPRHPARDNPVITLSVKGVRNANGDWFPTPEERVAEGAPLTGLTVLPGAAARPGNAPTPAALAKKLDAGLTLLVSSGKKDIACNLVLDGRSYGRVFWLAPDRLAVTQFKRVNAEIRTATAEALCVNPLLRSYAVSFAGAVAKRVPDGIEVTAGRRVYRLDDTTAVRSVTLRDEAGRTALRSTLRMAPAGAGSGALAASIHIEGATVGGAVDVTYRYTRSPGFTFLRRLIIKRAGGETVEIRLEGFQVDEGQAAEKFGVASGGGLFDD